MIVSNVKVVEVDPQGPDATALLREAAIEARALYPDLHPPGAPWPTNPPTPVGGVYLVGYVDELPVACGALRPLEGRAVEVRRMFVTKSARRTGLARIILGALEAEASRMGYGTMRLETGYCQVPAAALYTAYRFRRIEPFGEYASDPTSVCFEKIVVTLAERGA